MLLIFSEPFSPRGIFCTEMAIMLARPRYLPLRINHAAQTDQTEPLDLSISKVKEVGSKSQSLSVEGVSDEGIKPLLRLVPIETLMEVVELSKQRECLRKKRLCNVCQKEVVNMKVHMITHTGEKPYSCSICKKNFTQLGNMKMHMLTHTGEKPYSCPICKKNFTQFVHMKEHMMTHAGEKPYSCPICGKCSSRKQDLQAHMVTHDMNRPVYHCTVCSKGFMNKKSLKSHMLKH
ncbi:Uncharacterized protein BM_BM17839 [Brugia malayi]|uniref:C2H2-type domain-containing protein n=1 Tax=Brugia malayi TaxID=6279 RepID=A0A4E9FUH4_BRUMA|nr:Uncharacterized protein BM_BM17839 [Brugia malayi]VIO99521.1 Uncharacterized protein BM_BM17839 [Brugia malayi]